MKDKITLKKFIWTIIGFLLLFFVIVPLGETLIYQSRYQNPNKDLVHISNDDYDMNINSFTSSGRDGFVNIDIVKKSDKWKYAEVQVIDKDGYIIHREYIDLSDVNVGEKINVEFSFKGEDAAYLNIVGSDEIKEPDTILNRLKNKIEDSFIYKMIERIYNDYIRKLFNLDFNFDELKLRLKEIPIWIRISIETVLSSFLMLDPGLRAVSLIIFAMQFI